MLPKNALDQAGRLCGVDGEAVSSRRSLLLASLLAGLPLTGSGTMALASKLDAPFLGMLTYGASRPRQKLSRGERPPSCARVLR